ncbi:MAG TPA: six-hairpin glycosidase, partial [Clostridiaceae bacterium]|nr:six-hairpin glycosidase [Clostridiaceae bacterium]
MGRDNSYQRLYNSPWYATLFVELYRLYVNKNFLAYACRILKDFYRRGGYTFYAIELPVLSLDKALKMAQMEQEQKEMRKLFVRHAGNIMQIGLHYPVSEVNFEQSIVAPAADILFQIYILTKEQKYLDAGREHLRILEQFNGIQPDYHLYETAIRHWDGYWFGKKKLYGDTFPHYWSALTGNV